MRLYVRNARACVRASVSVPVCGGWMGVCLGWVGLHVSISFGFYHSVDSCFYSRFHVHLFARRRSYLPGLSEFVITIVSAKYPECTGYMDKGTPNGANNHPNMSG